MIHITQTQLSTLLLWEEETESRRGNQQETGLANCPNPALTAWLPCLGVASQEAGVQQRPRQGEGLTEPALYSIFAVPTLPFLIPSARLSSRSDTGTQERLASSGRAP